MAETKIRLSSQALAGSLSLAIVGDGIFTANAAGRGKFQAGFVDTSLLADGSVTTVKIVDDSVTTAKLADGSVTTAKLGDASVTTVKVADGAITNAKLASDNYAGSGGNFGTATTLARSDHSHTGLGGFDVTNEDLTSQVGDGDPTVFTLAHSDNIVGSEMVFLNGILQRPGASNDYTAAAGSITFNTAPVSGDVVLISYNRS
jgi:hypothetical protein